MSSDNNMAMELAKLQQGSMSQIKTPQELVHVKHDISILQYKYWILMLRTYRELYEEGERCGNDDMCFLSMDGLAHALGYRPKTKEIEADLEAIRKQQIVYNVLEKDKTAARKGQGFISEWYVSSNKVGVKFPQELRKAVENLDSKDSLFHLLNWQIFNSFSGKYEAIIYKLCKDYVGNIWTKKFSVEQYRDYMGIKPDEYVDFKRLNQWCISGPVKRINESELSDIVIETILGREKRKVVSVQFKVALKRQTVLDFGEDPAFRFAKVKIPAAQQRKYLSSASPEIVEASILRANEYAEDLERKGEEVNMGAVYAKAMSENWGVAYLEKKKASAAKVETKRKAAAAAAGQAADSKLRKEFEEVRKAMAEEILEGLGEAGVRDLFERWVAEKTPTPIESKKGVKAVAFRIWARTQVLPKAEEAEFEAWRASKAS